eukprot:TRINITY_DN8374_c0_g1_i5.p2 TRINITY_DN8374_c0_g1~~TRINITY_DN8374_c0_g1_i5.p2  ORF type:complete len:203 (-),score=-15.10 TRINITY_DN8374_c0_g1_i5:434-1042(-)
MKRTSANLKGVTSTYFSVFTIGQLQQNIFQSFHIWYDYKQKKTSKLQKSHMFKISYFLNPETSRSFQIRKDQNPKLSKIPKGQNTKTIHSSNYKNSPFYNSIKILPSLTTFTILSKARTLESCFQQIKIQIQQLKIQSKNIQQSSRMNYAPLSASNPPKRVIQLRNCLRQHMEIKLSFIIQYIISVQVCNINLIVMIRLMYT